MIENLSKEAFAAHAQTDFQIWVEDAPVLSLKLVEVSGPGVENGQERFALLFQGPLETPLGQGMQQLKHEQMGTLDLFLVPVSRERDGMCYEAVFNRLLK